PLVQVVRPEVPAKLAAMIDRCLEKLPAKRFQTGDDLARVVGDARGRAFRAPPLVRAFTRNAQVSTMVLFAMMLAGQSVTVAKTGVTVSLGGPGIIGIILLCQLMIVARRLLKDGYGFEDIRAALLAEAQVQAEEAEVIKQRRWLRRLDTVWYKLWAGPVGRWFFKVAGCRLKPSARPATASVERTELVLERSALAAYNALPAASRRQTSDVPRVLGRLEAGAEALRAKGDTGARPAAGGGGGRGGGVAGAGWGAGRGGGGAGGGAPPGGRGRGRGRGRGWRGRRRGAGWGGGAAPWSRTIGTVNLRPHAGR